MTDPGFRTIGQTFLRGSQVTDATGTAQFVPIYPGWYPGRTVHQHFKIRTTPAAPQGYAFTSQLYFDDKQNPQSVRRNHFSGEQISRKFLLFSEHRSASNYPGAADTLTDRVHAQAPYASKGPRMVRNRDDGLFADEGTRLVRAFTEHGEGYAATFTIGLQLG